MEQKQQKQELKEIKQQKLCPLISGFLLEPKEEKDEKGNTKIVFDKTTNMSPCIKDRCVFFDEIESRCKFIIIQENLSSLQVEDEDVQGEGTDNE